MQRSLQFTTLLFAASSAILAQSVITTRLEDPKAVYLTAAEFGVHADGRSDDSAAIQAAIDKAENHAREGIVFVPAGRYLLTRTVYIWPGVRVFRGSPLRAECWCSGDSVEAMLKSVSQDDRDHMVEDGNISVSCEFCSATYDFDEPERRALSG